MKTLLTMSDLRNDFLYKSVSNQIHPCIEIVERIIGVKTLMKSFDS